MGNALQPYEIAMTDTHTEYRMDFVCTRPGIRRDFDEWGDGLVNFGYERCECVDPFRFAAGSLDEAKEIAAQHWQDWLAKPHDDTVEGYWIVAPDDLIVSMHTPAITG